MTKIKIVTDSSVTIEPELVEQLDITVVPVSYTHLALSSGRQVQGIDTRVTNYGCNSIGNILQHGVILEKATLTFNGIGHIIKGAKGADAQQESRVLMLSDQARSDANPILLIDENDVTAGHAASIGQVDPEDMYYLMSRGLDKATAERLVCLLYTSRCV